MRFFKFGIVVACLTALGWATEESSSRLAVQLDLTKRSSNNVHKDISPTRIRQTLNSADSGNQLPLGSASSLPERGEGGIRGDRKGRIRQRKRRSIVLRRSMNREDDVWRMLKAYVDGLRLRRGLSGCVSECIMVRCPLSTLTVSHHHVSPTTIAIRNVGHWAFRANRDCAMPPPID